ncbi:hypothetical protein GCM10020367_24440 [Streptomyces sannanensis]|uniref:Uncharacterized protein n=1 Tax=Streptomyces sannanensis TaxID=285536 RepID=A0ABP6SAE7_9ACTN
MVTVKDPGIVTGVPSSPEVPGYIRSVTSARSRAQRSAMPSPVVSPGAVGSYAAHSAPSSRTGAEAARPAGFAGLPRWSHRPVASRVTRSGCPS